MLQSARASRALSLLSVPRCTSTQRRTIKSRHTRITPDKPAPWPYRDYGFSKIAMIYDGTLKRIDESSRIIVVEGNIGCGKSKVAKALAEELDFYYMPEFTPEHILTNSTGVDRRDYYQYLPTSHQLPDMKMFYDQSKPITIGQAALLCLHMFYGRHEQHYNAVAHLLNTGQGVVMERSVFSDFVFVNAMRLKKLISPQFFRLYHFWRNNIMDDILLHPHLCIYLDVPAEQCLENIKKRGRPEEISSTILDLEYLKVIESSYKDMIRELERKTKMLIYDQPIVTEEVVEDVEGIDLNFFESHSMSQLEDWFMTNEDGKWSMLRDLHTSKDRIRLTWGFLRNHMIDCHEMYCTPEDAEQYGAVIRKFLLPNNNLYPWHQKKSLWHTHWFGKNAIVNGLMYGHGTIQDDVPWYEHWHKDLSLAAYRAQRYEFYDHSGDMKFVPDYNHH